MNSCIASWLTLNYLQMLSIILLSMAAITKEILFTMTVLSQKPSHGIIFLDIFVSNNFFLWSECFNQGRRDRCLISYDDTGSRNESPFFFWLCSRSREIFWLKRETLHVLFLLRQKTSHGFKFWHNVHFYQHLFLTQKIITQSNV